MKKRRARLLLNRSLSQDHEDPDVCPLKSEGLENNIKVKICDYRDIDGLYDRIVSIEMLEAVGPEYYGIYFRKCDKLLKPNGKLVIQVITIPDERYDSYKSNPDWIQKHIFPGGMLPSLSLLNKAVKDNTILKIEQIDDIGIHLSLIHI